MTADELLATLPDEGEPPIATTPQTPTTAELLASLQHTHAGLQNTLAALPDLFEHLAQVPLELTAADGAHAVTPMWTLFVSSL